MKTSVIQIGNSRGIRIPKPVLSACGFEDEAEMVVANGDLIIRSAHKARQGWNEAFASMACQGDDALVDPETKTEWDEAEWEWK